MVMKLDQLVNGAINVGFGAAAVAVEGSKKVLDDLNTKGEQVRKALQAKKVYVPLLWPEAAAAEHDPVGRAYARNILPLPVDQRYTPEDMERMLAILTPLLG